MKKFIKRIKCKVFGHRYTTDIFYDSNVQKLKCLRCGKYFGINHSVKSILDWDQELEDTMKLIYPDI